MGGGTEGRGERRGRGGKEGRSGRGIELILVTQNIRKENTPTLLLALAWETDYTHSFLAKPYSEIQDSSQLQNISKIRDRDSNKQIKQKRSLRIQKIYYL